jgi:hypothetical protein
VGHIFCILLLAAPIKLYALRLNTLGGRRIWLPVVGALGFGVLGVRSHGVTTLRCSKHASVLANTKRVYVYNF